MAPSPSPSPQPQPEPSPHPGDQEISTQRGTIIRSGSVKGRAAFFQELSARSPSPAWLKDKNGHSSRDPSPAARVAARRAAPNLVQER